MQLPEEIHKRLAAEFRIAADAVNRSSDLASKVYFFSILNGEPIRQINTHWDPALNLLQMVAAQAVGQLQNRAPVPSPPDSPEGLPLGYYDALNAVTEEMAQIFEADDIDDLRLFRTIARIAELSYVTSGNGN